MPTLRRRIRSSIALFAIASSLVGCAGSTSAQVGVMYGYDVVYVDPPPAYIYGYTPVYYRSYPAYWVDGRWYYYSPRGWVVFRQEPPALRNYRIREYRGMYSAPPIQRYRPLESPGEYRYRVPARPAPDRYRQAPPRAPERPPAPRQAPTQERRRVPAR